MLSSIDINSENSFTVPIIGARPKDSLLVRFIKGLEAPARTLFQGDYARDGGTVNGSRVGARNIIIAMDLNPNPALGETVSDLREELYKAFYDPLVDADYLQLGLHLDDGRHLYVVGYTETFEGEIFSSDPVAQFSLVCPDPYIRDNVPTLKEHATGWYTVPFQYKGTADTGFEVKIHVYAATSQITLTNNSVTDDPDHAQYHKGRMILTRSFNIGDVITINTVAGQTAVTLDPAGSAPPQSIVSSLSVYSPWIQLHSQGNVMRVYGATPASTPAAIRLLRYTQTYWGL